MPFRQVFLNRKSRPAAALRFVKRAIRLIKQGLKLYLLVLYQYDTEAPGYLHTGYGRGNAAEIVLYISAALIQYGF